MPRICHVHFCPNSNSRTSSAVLKLHTIPKGASQEISDQWIKFCGRKKGDSNILLNVCHLHFKDSDYNFSKEVSQQVGIKRGLIKNALPSIKAISSSPNNRPTPRERTANRAEREQQTIMQTKLEASVLEKEISDMRLVLDKKIVKLSQIHQRLERLERMSGMDLISRIDELTRQNSEILSKTDIKKFNFNVPEVETEISGDLISCDINELKIELPDEPEMEVKLEESCVVDNSPDNQAVDPFDLNSEFVECEKQKPAEIKPQNLKYVLLKLGSDKIPSLCTIPNATNIVKIDSSVKSTNSWITPKISKVYYNSEPKSIVIQAKKTIIYPQYKPTSYIKILPRPKLTIIKSNIPNVTQPLIVNKELVLKPLNIETYNKKQQAHIVTPSCSSTNQIKVEDLSTDSNVSFEFDQSLNLMEQKEAEMAIELTSQAQSKNTILREPPTVKPKINCNFCDKSFSTEELLHRHRNQHPFDPPLICDKCGNGYKMKSHLWRHLNKVHSKVSSVCPTCGKLCSSYQVLTYHLRTHSKVKRFNCEKCGKGFNYQHHFKSHKNGHLDLRPFVCSICKMGFNRKDNMIAHFKRHKAFIPNSKKIIFDKDPSKMNCPLDPCSFTCTFKITMDAHLRKQHQLTMTPLTCRCHAKIFATKEEYDQHADCNKIACDVCKILFKTKEKMLEHHSTVHGEFNVRPFKCDLCGDQFKRIEHLRSHLNYKHNNRERKFKCNYCDYKGKFQTDLNAHLKNHFDELKHVCRVCGKKFANIHGFRKHNIVDHGIKKIYLCNCGEGFLYFAELRSHKKTNICKIVSEQLQ